MKKQTIIDKLKSDAHVFVIPTRARTVVLLVLAAAGLFLYSYVISLNLVIPLFLLCAASYLIAVRRELARPFELLHVALLYVLIVAAGYLVKTHGFSDLWIPFSVIPMLAVLLFNDRMLTFFLTVASAVTIAPLTDEPMYMAVLFLISGLLAGILVFGARGRKPVIGAGIIIGAAQVLAFFLIEKGSMLYPQRYLYFFLNGVISGIFVLGVLSIFESLFGTITNISLLEMADFNNPLLNRLMLEAPGTYHHSLIVGNLSEAACKAVGANALLARIGAYYHDIGKLQKSEYFTENQSMQQNVHETLAPNMSKLVIMNHIKEGMDLAKKYRLNRRITDFIQQHHGTSLVYFFYRRALESSQMHEEVTEEGFRYPGPRPKTKEIAVVLLADSVEAATRALKEPTPPQIEETVHKIINNKFIDGQLDECDLTLKDLEIIAGVFSHILSGMYHSRVNYPEAGRENNHKEPPKENPHQSPGNHAGNP